MNGCLIYRGGPNSMTRRSRRAAVLFLIAASLVGMALVSASAALGSKTPLRPPDGVYTCSWIAEHLVEAAKARVSCDRREFIATGKPTLAFARGSFIPVETGDGWVPGPTENEKVGKGVFAWTSYKYTNWWAWYAWVLGANDYTWYIQKPGNITKAYGRVFNDSLYFTPPNFGANNHRWGAQNHYPGPRNWRVFWDVR